MAQAALSSKYPDLGLIFIGVIAVCLVFICIYRVFFSKISHIPGPKLAALTYWYQFYFDVFPQQGRFLWQIQKLHQQYGPIVRIGPDEVHVHDIGFLPEIYTTDPRRKRNKSPLGFSYMQGTGFGDAVFGTIDHDLHRHRRSVLNPYFSKKMVQELEPRIKKWCFRLRDLIDNRFVGKEELLNLTHVSRALTTDVIAEYSFGEAQAFKFLDMPTFGTTFTNTMVSFTKINPFARRFPWLARFLMNVKLPPWLARYSPMFEANEHFMSMVHGRVSALWADAKSKKQEGRPSHRSVVQSVMDSEGQWNRAFAEANTLIAAGMETNAKALSVTLYHILANPPVYESLLAELRAVMPTGSRDLPAVAVLEHLEYFNAVILEGIRVAHPVASRQQRVAPLEDLDYNGVIIPAGVTVSESTYLLNTDPNMYPEPLAFRPDRFLGADGKALMKSFVPFGRGARSCLGMNLAYAELHLTIALLLTSFRMVLADTNERDVTTVGEYLIGALPDDSKGIRVRVLATM